MPTSVAGGDPEQQLRAAGLWLAPRVLLDPERAGAIAELTGVKAGLRH